MEQNLADLKAQIAANEKGQQELAKMVQHFGLDVVYGALGVMAAAQGTMNNFVWGDDRYQYYETICGGFGKA